MTQAQTLSEVFSSHIQPQSTTIVLQEGLKQIETICEATPNEKCSKAKASAYYLIADRYFEAAHEVLNVDPILVTPILKKANDYFSKANTVLALENFTAAQQSMMIDAKRRIESSTAFKTL